MNRQQLKGILKGTATRVPPMNRVLRARAGVGTASARYCYTVFLRQLVRTREVYDFGRPVPERVAELGPGNSIGVGIAALLAGAERYSALDAVAHAVPPKQLDVFDELVELFTARAPIPGPDEFPEVRPSLKSYRFPVDLLSDEWLHSTLAPARVSRIREAIATGSGMIRYIAPWDDLGVIKPESVEWLLSQAVLEHVVDLPGTYDALNRWLIPGGVMSHTIDFRSHGHHPLWNGHWSYSDRTWRLILGGRPYLLNREPASTHRQLLRERFDVIVDEETTRAEGIARDQLAPRFAYLSEADLSTSGIYVIARKFGLEQGATAQRVQSARQGYAGAVQGT